MAFVPSLNPRSLNRRSMRLSQCAASQVEEAKQNCIASCACVVHQPLNVPTVDAMWESTHAGPSTHSQPMVSSKDHVVYLYHSDLDDCYHLTVIKQTQDKIFLTISLQSSSGLTYSIKNQTWHQITVYEDNKPRNFILELVRGSDSELLTQKVKDIYLAVEHGRNANGSVGNLEATHANMAESVTPTMPSGPKRLPSETQMSTEHLQQVVELLQAAILAGDAEKSRRFVDSLAADRAYLDMNLNKAEHEKRANELSISVKVHVEDRETSGCDVTMRVKPSDTIGALKRMMFLEYEFPMEVQRWIIEKKIPADTDTLYRCHVRTSGYTLYLYLTTARSMNLDPNQADAMNTSDVRMNTSDVSGDYLTMNALRASGRGASGSLPRHGRAGNRPQPSMSSSSASTLSPLPEAANQNTQHGNPALFHTTSTPNIHHAHDRVHAQNVPVYGGQVDNVFTLGSAVEPGYPQAGVMPAGPRLQKPAVEIGWECPRCTFINKPTRPGCEVCSGNRPPDYEVPIGYIMTNEELCWLAEKEDQERMVKETDERRGSEARVNNEQLTEEQLDLVLRFNDAIVDLQHRNQGLAGEIDMQAVQNQLPNLYVSTDNSQPGRGEDVPDHGYNPSDNDNNS